MKPADILRHAASIVEGARADTHGSYARNMEIVASFWSAYLGCTVTPRDVCQMMVLLKIARTATGDGKEIDHYLDAAGWAALGGAIATADK